MEQVQQVIFNPTLTTLSSIKSFVLSQQSGTAHPFNTEKTMSLILNKDGILVSIDISSINKSSFLNSAKITDLEENIYKMINKYSQIKEISQFTLQVLNQGDIISIKTQQNQKNIIVITNKNGGNYFDLSLYTRKKNSDSINSYNVLTYNNKNIYSIGLNHSGDIGSLLHYISNFNEKCNGYDMYVSVVGYNKKSLVNFINQQPSILLVDYENCITYIVSCPLDEATMGKSSIAHLVHVEYSNSTITCTVLQKPSVQKQLVNTGDIGTAEKSLLNADRVYSSTVAAFATKEETIEQEVTDEIVQNIKSDVITTEPSPCTIFIESGLQKYNFLPDVPTIYYGDSFTLESSNPDTILPHVFGPITGMSGSLGKVSTILPYRSPINIVVAKTMTDTNARTVTKLGNCIMIIDSEVELENPSRNIIESTLDKVNISPACMLGGNSILLVKIGNELYWYRGVRYHGLVSNVFCYGDNVTKFFTKDILTTWVKSGVKFGWNSIISSTDKSVYFENKIMSVESAIEIIKQYTVKKFKSVEPEIIDLFTQISCVLTTPEVVEFVKTVDNYILQIMNSQKQKYIVSIKDTYSSENKELINKTISNFREFNRNIKKEFDTISKALGNLTSIKGISSKTQSVARRARSNAISSNVSTVNNMSAEEKIEKFSEWSDNMVMLSIDKTNLLDSISVINTFNDQITSGKTFNFILDDRMPYLDALSVSSLLEICTNETSHALHSNDGIAIPKGMSGSHKEISLLPIPLLEHDINLKDPMMVDWANRANDEEVALYRIMLRDQLANASSLRDYKLQPQQKELGYFIINLYLSAIENIVSGMSQVPNPETDWDSSNCEAIRGLFGQLLSTMGSTNRTLCPAYLLFYKNPNIRLLKENELWIIERIQKVLKYSCWNTSTFDLNVKKYIVKNIYNSIVCKPITTMQKYINMQKSVSTVKTTEWYDYIRVLVTFIMNCAENKTILTKQQAENMLSLAPSEVTNGTRMMMDFINSIKKYYEQFEITDNESSFLRIVQIACFSYIKHSDNVEPSNKRNIKDTIHTAKSLEDYVSTYQQIKLSTWKSSNSPTYESNMKFVEENSLPNDLSLSIINNSTDSRLDIIKKNPGSTSLVSILNNIHLYVPGEKTIPKQFYTILENLGIKNPDITIQNVITEMLYNYHTTESIFESGILQITN